MSKRCICTLCGLFVILLVGCAPNQANASPTSNPIRVTEADLEEISESVPQPSASPDTELQITRPSIDLLTAAVRNLVEAESYQMVAHEDVSYQGIGPDGSTNPVYGEFKSNYIVIQHPQFTISSHYEYRFAPGLDYSSYDTYGYQDAESYYSQLIEPSGASTPQEVELNALAPFSSGVYQTLITYSAQAKKVSENGNLAVYHLKHPRWYLLESAVGFADLGFLSGQENGEELIEEYVADHYPDVEPIEFWIYVAVDELLISKVEVDNRAFMRSIWSAVENVLLEQGVDAQSLTRYVIGEDHHAEYSFIKYNQIQQSDLDP